MHYIRDTFNASDILISVYVHKYYNFYDPLF